MIEISFANRRFNSRRRARETREENRCVQRGAVRNDKQRQQQHHRQPHSSRQAGRSGIPSCDSQRPQRTRSRNWCGGWCADGVLCGGTSFTMRHKRYDHALALNKQKIARTDAHDIWCDNSTNTQTHTHTAKQAHLRIMCFNNVFAKPKPKQKK